jgi:hypothetical protein
MRRPLALVLSIAAAVAVFAVAALGWLGSIGDALIYPTLLTVFGSSANVHQPDPNSWLVALVALLNIAALSAAVYFVIRLAERARAS